MYYNEKLDDNQRTVIKINNEIKVLEQLVLSDEEILLLKKALFGNKPNLCPDCETHRCICDKRKLKGAIFEGMSTAQEQHITICGNYRNNNPKTQEETRKKTLSR